MSLRKTFLTSINNSQIIVIILNSRFIFGLLACVTLLAVSCEPNTTAQDDELYEVGVEKSDISV